MSEWHPCYDSAESIEHLRDLKLAHASADDVPDGIPLSSKALEEVQADAVSWFAQWPTAKQLKFLRDLPADEAALLLEGTDAQLRDRLTSLLSSESREVIEAVLGKRSGVSVLG